MPINFEPEFEPETKGSKSFSPAFEPEFEEEKATKKSSIPGAEGFDEKASGITEAPKKEKFSLKNFMGNKPDIEHGVKVAQDILIPAAAGAASLPVGLIGGALDTVVNSGRVNFFTAADKRAADLMEQANKLTNNTEEGERANKLLEENLYRNLPAMGATGFHVGPGAAAQRMLANERAIPRIPEKMGPMIPNELRAPKIGPEVPPELRASQIGPNIPQEASSSMMGPRNQLAVDADLASLRSVLGEDSVNALRERMAQDASKRETARNELAEQGTKEQQRQEALADVEKLRGALSDESVNALRNRIEAGQDVSTLRRILAEDQQRALSERVGADAETHRQTLKQLEELSARDAAEELANRPPVGGQYDMFGMKNTEGMASPFEPNRAVEPIEPLRQRRQMEIPFESETAPVMTGAPEGMFNRALTPEEHHYRDIQEQRLVERLNQVVPIAEGALPPNELPGVGLQSPEVQSLIQQRQAGLPTGREPSTIRANVLPQESVMRTPEAPAQEALYRAPYQAQYVPESAPPTPRRSTVRFGYAITPEELVHNAPTPEAAVAHIEHQQSGKEFPNEPLVEGKTVDKTGREWNTKVTQEFRNGEISVTVGVHDPASGGRAGVVEFRVNSDGTISAENAIVSANMKGRGLSEAMYQAAKDAGYDIVPGRYQTAEGAAMVKNLQEKGIIGKGDITPLPAPEGVKAQEARVEGDRAIKAAEEYQPSDKPYKSPEEASTTVPVTGQTADAVTAMKDIPGFGKGMSHFEPIELSTPAFLDKFKDWPDIAQNLVQKAFNWTTKGSTYMNTRLNDPFFKRVTDRFKMAESNIQAATRELIHKKGAIEPLLRSLTKEEYSTLPEVIRQAWKDGAELTPEMLRGMKNEKGERIFSENAITVNEALKKFQNKLFEEHLKPAADLAGIKNVSQDVSYYASRATGDYRVRVYKGDRPLGQLSANTKLGLMNEIRKYGAESKGHRIGEREYYGGSGKNASSEGLNQLYQYLADNNPELAQHISDMYGEINTRMASKYLGAEKHTMEKQGLFGMAGDNPNAGKYSNSKDFWDSQIQSAQNVIRWAEISKAMADSKEVASLPGRPNSNALIKRYIDNAMGRNPSAVGRRWDALYADIGDLMGIGTTLPKDALSGIKQAANIKLLAASVKFYLGNFTQQMARSPELAAFLYSKGLKVRDVGLSDMVLGMVDAATDKNVAAQAYAEKHHVYSSDLFETSNRTRRGFGFAVDQTTKPAAAIEQYTRKSFYMTAVRTLERNGYAGDKLYGTAHELTNMFMNNYNPSEARMASPGLLGTSVGRGANNLLSYSHNELSRLAMHLDAAIEGVPKGDLKTLAPLATNVITNVAMAGLVGTVGYKEADYIVKKFSEMVGKPTSLSAVLTKSDGTAADIVKYGIPSYYTGMDLTQSLGGGNIVPDMTSNPLDTLLPGSSSLVDAGVSTAKAAWNPTEFNVKKAVRDIAPNGPVQGLLDRIWGSKLGEPDPKTGKVPEMGINWNKITGQVRRNDTDKLAKSVGMTSLRESMIKQQDYAQDQIDKFYSDKRKDAVIDMKEALFTKNKKDMQGAIQKYIKNEGDAAKLDGDLTKAVQDQSISIEEANMLRAQKGDLPAAKSIIRRFAK